MWAKVFGSYHRIERGSTGEAMPYLTHSATGFHVHEKFNRHPDLLWKIIENADIKGYMMTTAVSSEANSEQNQASLKKAGLVDGHAYSLISAVNVDISPIKKQKMVLIRNPWGFKEWEGDWGDNSKLWKEYPSAKKNIEKILQSRDMQNPHIIQNKENDGLFWMAFEDFIN